MKINRIGFTFFMMLAFWMPAWASDNRPDSTFVISEEIIKISSRLPGLNLALLHQSAQGADDDFAVLFLHGSSFPSALSFGFKMSGSSWMDHLSERGYDVFALDFLGYGNSDRYSEMTDEDAKGKGLGKATEVYLDVDRAVDFILKTTGQSKVYLIGHSWGGTVAALYASRYPEKIAKLVLFATITGRQGHKSIPGEERRYEELTPEQRVEMMRSLTPSGKECQLEPEITGSWGANWLASDGGSAKRNSGRVRFPAGYRSDVLNLINGHSYYSAADIKAPTLVIRGQWDSYPNDADGKKLYRELTVSEKKYVVVERGTHVVHLEKQRHRAYEEVYRFLKEEDGGNTR